MHSFFKLLFFLLTKHVSSAVYLDSVLKSASESYVLRVAFSFKKFRCLKTWCLHLCQEKQTTYVLFLLWQISEVCVEQWHIIFPWIVHTHNPETLIFATLIKYIETNRELLSLQMFFFHVYTKSSSSVKHYYPHINVKIPQEKHEEMKLACT